MWCHRPWSKCGQASRRSDGQLIPRQNALAYCVTLSSEGTKGPDARPELTELRRRLLDLHKALIDSERIGYEKVFGSVSSSADFLDLLIRDPWFGWLRPVSELIVLIDETLDGAGPILPDVLARFQKSVRVLLTPSDISENFASHYVESLQREADVIFAHGEVVKTLPVVKRAE